MMHFIQLIEHHACLKQIKSFVNSFLYITGLAVGERMLSPAVPGVPGLSSRGLLPPAFDPFIQHLLHLDLCHSGLQ